jgi:carbamoyl-phosphate synthase large subunit
MKKPITVLITGAGGAALPFLIQDLQKKGIRVLAADMDPLATGLLFADKGFIIPPGKSDLFLPKISEICESEKVDVLIPLVDEELVKSASLVNGSVDVLLPQKEFVEICLDKYLLMKKLDENEIRVPYTILANENPEHFKFPVVLKPRQGRGSRGVQILHSLEELHIALKNTDYASEDMIIQDYIGGTEFTVSVVIWKDGIVQAVVPKEIISKRGITQLAVTRKNRDIDDLCLNIQDKLKADGPINVQLRIDKKSGIPYVFEINPRYSTTVTLTVKAGIDEIFGLIEQACNGRDSYSFGNWEEGVVLVRQTLDGFMDESEFKSKEIINYRSQ